MPNHYEVLGIKPDASKADIKKAYRKKASDLHPDRPENKGRDTEMAEVNKAWSVLGDPLRRLTYDQRGNDSIQPFDEEVNATLSEVFNFAIGQGLEQNVLAFCIQLLNQKKNSGEQMKQASVFNSAKLQKMRRRLSKKGESRNIYHDLIDQQLEQHPKIQAQADHVIAVCSAAIAFLQEYDEDAGGVYSTTVILTPRKY